MPRHKIPAKNAEDRSKEVAQSRGRDGVQTIYAYDFIDGFLIVNEGDLQGLTMAEIQSATPYVEPIEENI